MSALPESSSLQRFSFWPLLGLHSFAVVQPILEQLSRNLRYLQQQNFATASVVLCIAIHLLAVPGLLWGIITLVRSRGFVRTSVILFDCSLFCYALLLALLTTRWISSVSDFLTSGIPDILAAVVVLPVPVFVIWAHRRSILFRQLVTCTVAGVLLFPANFFASPVIRQVVFGTARANPGGSSVASNPAPVVMIIFDGLSGGSLLNENDEIDRDRFPSFARLASSATMYRNTTTVHPRTNHAVPAMLSSMCHDGEVAPVEANYPKNLLRMIYDTDQYEMTVFEPVTELAPVALQQFKRYRSIPEETWEMFFTTTLVFLQISLPREMPQISARVPRAWFGLLPLNRDFKPLLKGKIRYPWDRARTAQMNHFVSTIQRGRKPTFHFLHVALPHYPWSLLPNGRTYNVEADIASKSIGLQQETISSDPWFAEQLWQRNLLQIQLADRGLGEILDRLEAEQIFDDALIVVTADHGMSFRPGEGLREVSGNVLADIVSVPLLIKMPRQKNSAISDRNVETIDIAPTMANVLGLSIPEEWQGISVTSSEAKPRKMLFGSFPTVIEPDFPQRREFTRRLIEVFGTGANGDRLGRLNVLPELVGQRIDVSALPASQYRVELAELGLAGDPDFVPCQLEGTLMRGSEEATYGDPVHIAVVVDGRIRVTTRTSRDPGDGAGFAALLPWDELFGGSLPEFLECQKIGGVWEFRRIESSQKLATQPKN